MLSKSLSYDSNYVNFDIINHDLNFFLMARFTTRIELINAEGFDYTILHEEMENKGFTRTITNSSTGIIYNLPEAEYNFISSGDTTKNNVLDLAKKACIEATKNTKLKFRILVTKSNGRTWHNLTKFES